MAKGAISQKHNAGEDAKDREALKPTENGSGEEEGVLKLHFIVMP